MRFHRHYIEIIVAFTILLAGSAFAAGQPDASHGEPSARVDEAHRQLARQAIDKAIEYLRSTQHESTGGWSIDPDKPDFPAITGLVITGMLLDERIDSTDPTVVRGVDYLLSMRQPDGGIYDELLPNYNTSIALSALALADHPNKREIVTSAQDYLRSLQWESQVDPNGEPITPNHPFYGGVGYGGHGRPDNSNLNMMLEALHDSGVDPDDPAIQRAVAFLERTQMLDSVNDMPYADGSEQGGFIYATSTDKDHIGSGESKAGAIVETLDDGTNVSRLRAYGSMTYAGFKSYIYADLDRDDPRVQAALDWIRSHYTLDENPGVGQQGYYYYLLTFARALDAWGAPAIVSSNADGSTGETHHWANELIDKLASLQRDDGSFVNEQDRWMEGNADLVTAYALVALQHAIRE